jgi:predicted ATPase
VVRAELQTAQELGTQCLTLAQRARSPAFFLWAHYALGMTLFHLGEFASAREHVEQGIALYDPQKRRSHRALQDPGVACLSYRAAALWLLGFPDQALETSREALALAEKLSHPFSLSYALNLAALVCQFCRNVEEARERIEAADALASEQGVPFWLAWRDVLRGWALTEQGQRQGITQMRQGLNAYGAAGAEVARTYFLALLAEAHGKEGQAEEGLTVLAEALTVVDKTGERWWQAELHRLNGELLLAVPSGSHATAEACIQQACDVARRQGARSLELRAAVSLSRLWQRQGKQDEARELLGEIYDWFTEGFDTADLKEAKALLEELAT